MYSGRYLKRPAAVVLSEYNVCPLATEGGMNWTRLALITVGAGILTSLTDWFFAGDWFPLTSEQPVILPRGELKRSSERNRFSLGGVRKRQGDLIVQGR